MHLQIRYSWILSATQSMAATMIACSEILWPAIHTGHASAEPADDSWIVPVSVQVPLQRFMRDIQVSLLLTRPPRSNTDPVLPIGSKYL